MKDFNQRFKDFIGSLSDVKGKMSINDLPEELLENILSLLSPSDRLKSTLISRRLAEVFGASPFMNDVWLNLRGDLMNEAEAVISNSNRRYRNVRLDKANLFEYNPAFWMKIGMGLRELKLVDCNWSSKVFYRVLVACPNLESLAIYGGPSGSVERLSVQSFKLPTGMNFNFNFILPFQSYPNLQNIQESTRNLRHLHLGFFVNADMLERMLVAMPNVSSISLSRFCKESDFLDRLPSMLGTRRGITKLSFNPAISSAATWEKLLRISSNTLRELVTRDRNTYFYRKTYEALVDCTMLRTLRIILRSEIDDNLLRDILRNCSQLEILELEQYSSNDPFLSHRALMPILELTKLRELRLDLNLTTRSDLRVSNEFLHNLGGLSSLESLTLEGPPFEGFGDISDTSFQNWANLRNLRYLKLKKLHWTANCLTTFPFSLRRLRQLSIYGSRSCDDRVSTLAQLCESERAVIDSAICSRSDRSGGRIESSCLESLTMIGVPLTDVGLTCIVAHHGRLKKLTLWGCDNITAPGLIYLLQHEPLLEELHISRMDASSMEALYMMGMSELRPEVYIVEGC